MAHEQEQGPQGLEVSRSSSSAPEGGGARGRVGRTPPGVWPQVSQADMGRVVRRLRVAAERQRAEQDAPRMRLVSVG